MATEDVLIEIGAKIDKLLAATEQSGKAIEGLTDSVQHVSGAFKTLGTLIGITFTVDGLINFTEKMANLGVMAQRTVSEIGGTGEAISLLKGAAKLAGTDFDSLMMSVERTSLNIQRTARNSFDPTTQALKVMGLNAKDLVNVPVDTFILRLADATAKLAPGLTRTNALAQIGGKGIREMIPVFDLGSAGIKKFGEEWAAASAHIDPTAFASTHRELILLDRTLDRISKNIFAALQPAINLAIKMAREWLLAIKPEDIQSAVKAVMEWVITVAAGLAELFQELIKWADQAMGKIRQFTAAVGTFGSTIKYIVNPGAAVLDLYSWFITPVEDGVKAAEGKTPEWVTRMRAIADRIKAAMADAQGGAGGAGDKPQAKAIDYGIKERVDAEAQGLQARAALWQEWLNRQKLMIDQQVGFERLTAAEGVRAYREKSNQEYAIELDLAQKRRALYAGQPVERAKIDAEILQMQAKHTTEMVRSQLEEIRAIKQQWDGFFDSIRGAWDAQIDGLLRKQITWAEAFRNILATLLVEWAKWGEKKLQTYVTTLIAEKVAGEATEAEKVAAAAAGSAAALPAKIATFTSDITAASARTFAGVFAFLSPFMGPAAAGPAAAAQGSVLAELVNIPKFQMGSWDVPQDMLAMVHAGEKITPAGASGGGWQSGGGGGAVHVHAIDAQGVAQFIERNVGAFTQAVANHQRRNPSSRGKY